MPTDLATAPDGQLRLFVPPVPANGLAPTRRRKRPRLLVTFLAIGVATAGVIGGSYAAWTAQTANAGNSVTSGTLTMSNDKAAASVFTATNVVPGGSGSSTVSIQNTGSIPMAVRLTQDQLTATGIEASLGLNIHDQSRNWCYWPVSQAGACPSGFGAWNGTSTLSSLPILATDGSARWPAGQSHTFTISWQLSATSPNSDQGKTGSFRLVWDGLQ